MKAIGGRLAHTGGKAAWAWGQLFMRAILQLWVHQLPKGWNPSKSGGLWGHQVSSHTGQPALVKAGSYSAYKYKSAPVLSVTYTTSLGLRNMLGGTCYYYYHP